MASDGSALRGGNRAFVCRYCEAETPDSDRVRLWDGREYCVDCVEDVCPGLARYAREHDELVESPPQGVRAVWQPPAWLVVTVFLPALAGATYFKFGDLYTGAAILAAVPLLGVLVVIPFVSRWLFPFRRVRRIVRIQDGWIEIAAGQKIRRLPLNDITWSIGDLGQDPQLSDYPRDNAILLKWDNTRVVACGLSDEGFQTLAGFLTLASHQPTGWKPSFGTWARILGITVTAGLPAGVANSSALTLGEALGAFGVIGPGDYLVAVGTGSLLTAFFVILILLVRILRVNPYLSVSSRFWEFLSSMPIGVSTLVWFISFGLNHLLYLLCLLILNLVTFSFSLFLLRSFEPHWIEPLNGPRRSTHYVPGQDADDDDE